MEIAKLGRSIEWSWILWRYHQQIHLHFLRTLLCLLDPQALSFLGLQDCMLVKVPYKSLIARQQVRYCYPGLLRVWSESRWSSPLTLHTVLMVYFIWCKVSEWGITAETRHYGRDWHSHHSGAKNHTKVYQNSITTTCCIVIEDCHVWLALTWYRLSQTNRQTHESMAWCVGQWFKTSTHLIK